MKFILFVIYGFVLIVQELARIYCTVLHQKVHSLFLEGNYLLIPNLCVLVAAKGAVRVKIELKDGYRQHVLWILKFKNKDITCCYVL